MRLQFFGPKGLTSTSANHVANMAKEYYKGLEAKLNNLVFYSETTSANGQSLTTSIATSFEDLKRIPEIIQQIALSNSLIAWLREGIREKENAEVLTLEEWCKETGKEFPVKPVKGNGLTEDMVKSKWDVSKYCAYLTHQAIASTIGQQIHPDGGIANARNTLLEIINKPNIVKEVGRDLTVISRNPEYSPETIDTLFFTLQGNQREAQASFNSLSFEAEKEAYAYNVVVEQEYSAKMQEYKHAMEALEAEYKVYVIETNKKYKDLKIIIPESLQGIYDTIKSLGK